MAFTDVLDESDELLHHRHQLIYAIGKLQELPSLTEHAHSAQALLRAIKNRKQ